MTTWHIAFIHSPSCRDKYHQWIDKLEGVSLIEYDSLEKAREGLARVLSHPCINRAWIVETPDMEECNGGRP